MAKWQLARTLTVLREEMIKKDEDYPIEIFEVGRRIAVTFKDPEIEKIEYLEE
jgi:hypothetical protein